MQHLLLACPTHFKLTQHGRSCFCKETLGRAVLASRGKTKHQEKKLLLRELPFFTSSLSGFCRIRAIFLSVTLLLCRSANTTTAMYIDVLNCEVTARYFLRSIARWTKSHAPKSPVSVYSRPHAFLSLAAMKWLQSVTTQELAWLTLSRVTLFVHHLCCFRLWCDLARHPLTSLADPGYN